MNLQASYRTQRVAQNRRQLHALEALRQRQRRERPQRTAHVHDSAAAGVLRSGLEFPGGQTSPPINGTAYGAGRPSICRSPDRWPALAGHPRADPVRYAVRRGRHHPHPAVRGQSRLPAAARHRQLLLHPAGRVPDGDDDSNRHRVQLRAPAAGHAPRRDLRQFPCAQSLQPVPVVRSLRDRRSIRPC